MAVASVPSLTKTIFQETPHSFENSRNRFSKEFSKKKNFYQPNISHSRNNLIRSRCRESSNQQYSPNHNNAVFYQKANFRKRLHKLKKCRAKYLFIDKEIADEKYQSLASNESFTTMKSKSNCKELFIKKVPESFPTINNNENLNLSHDHLNFQSVKSKTEALSSLDLSTDVESMFCDNESAKCWIEQEEDNFEKEGFLIFKDAIRNRAHSWPSRTKNTISYPFNHQSTEFLKANTSIINMSHQLNSNKKIDQIIFPTQKEFHKDSKETPISSEQTSNDLSKVNNIPNEISQSFSESSNCNKLSISPKNNFSSKEISKDSDITVLEVLPNSSNLSFLEDEFQMRLKLHDCPNSKHTADNITFEEDVKLKIKKVNSSNSFQLKQSSSAKIKNEKETKVVMDFIVTGDMKDSQISNLIKICPNCRNINKSEFYQCSYCGVSLAEVKSAHASFRNKSNSQSKTHFQEEMKILKPNEKESPNFKKQSNKQYHKNKSERKKIYEFSPTSCVRNNTYPYYESIQNTISYMDSNPCLNVYRPHSGIVMPNHAVTFNDFLRVNGTDNLNGSRRDVLMNENILEKNTKLHKPWSRPLASWSASNISSRPIDGRSCSVPWHEQSQYFNHHHFGAVPKQKFSPGSVAYKNGAEEHFLGRRRAVTEYNLRSDHYLQSSNNHWSPPFHRGDGHSNQISSGNRPRRGVSSLSFSEVEELVGSSIINGENRISKNDFSREDEFIQRGYSLNNHSKNISRTIAESSEIVESKSGFTEIPYLPDEIMLHVFSFLSHHDLIKCALTCLRFCQIADDTSLWRSIVIKKNHNLCDDWLFQIGKRKPNNLSLIQCHGEKISSTGLELLFTTCSESLRELRFTSCSRGLLTGDTILLHAASYCHNLTYLDVSWCSVNDKGVCGIADASLRLETLCLNGCQSVTDDAITYVVSMHGNSLRTLEIYGCFCITARSMQAIASHCKNLTTLNLGQCHKLSDACIANLVVHLKNIENLDLRGCHQIRNNCVRRVARNCPKLKTLALSNCPQINDMALVDLSLHIPNLRSIDVCGCKNVTNKSIRELASNCQQLEYLDLSSTSINHESVDQLAINCNKRLESLKLSFCRNITENCIIHLAYFCKRLKTLHLYGCKNIRDLKAALAENPHLVIEM